MYNAGGVVFLGMRKIVIYLCVALLLAGCAGRELPEETTLPAACVHADSNDDWLCDGCDTYLGAKVDIIAVNDLHGKVADGDTHPGVDEMTTYIKQTKQSAEHFVLLSTGDMWQGSAESNITRGLLTTKWMNDAGFDAMALGNHEFDWGEEPIITNASLANFPILAINVYDRDTNQRVDYCDASVLIDKGAVQIGVIGAVGDCYSSISADKTKGIYFKVGDELTELVMAESESLRQQGADFIIYVIHDGYEQSKGGSITNVKGSQLSYYYDRELSDGYVDLVFEGHTHQRYVLRDQKGVYHLQNGGDNKGISQVQVLINTANSNWKMQDARMVATGTYANMEDDPIVAQLLEEYDGQLSHAARVVGSNSRVRSKNELRQLVADLYYEVGMETWGQEYDIALGGGFISVRDPGSLAAGDVTYAMLSGMFPFDNELVLCSIRGRELREKFFETDHYSYFISYGQYGEQLRNNIDPNGTYYVVVDTYTSSYAPNKLTEIARYKKDVFARDLLADYIGTGALD